MKQRKKILKKSVALSALALILFISVSWKKDNSKITTLKYAKISDFNLCHPASTITKDASYKELNKLSDDALKKACTNPNDGEYIRTKMGTFDLRNGNTRVYIMRERGFDNYSVPYEEVDTGNVCDF